MKIIHAADIHLGHKRFGRISSDGINERERDVFKVFTEFLEKAEALNPHLVLIAGDLFDSPRPSNYTLVSVFKALKASKLKFLIVPGNHDAPKKTEATSPIEILGILNNVFVVTRTSVFKMEDLAIFHLADDKLDSLTQQYYDNLDSRWKILIYHGLVKELHPKAEVSVNELNERFKFDYIALGDFHQYCKLASNCFYSGSFDFVSPNFWAEAGGNKGFIEVDLKNAEVSFHRLLGQRRVVVLPEIDCSTLTEEELEEILYSALSNPELFGAIVRLILRNFSPRHNKALASRRIRGREKEIFHLSVHYEFGEVCFSTKEFFLEGGLLKEFEAFLGSLSLESKLKSDLYLRFKNFINEVKEN